MANLILANSFKKIYMILKLTPENSTSYGQVRHARNSLLELEIVIEAIIKILFLSRDIFLMITHIHVLKMCLMPPLRKDLILVGQIVSLNRIVRKRIFELSFPISQPDIPELIKGLFESGQGVTITKNMSCSSHFYHRKKAGLPGTIPTKEARKVMGIKDDLMTSKEVGEAVPPPYARYIAEHVLNLMEKNI